MYNNIFNQTQRELVRKVLWPITKESIKERVTDNTLLYTRREPNKSWENDDKHKEGEEEEEYFDEEDFEVLSLEEYDNLPINEKHMYLDDLGYHFNFEPELVTPSKYRNMTEEDKQFYLDDMRWMASSEFLEYYEQEADLDEAEANLLLEEKTKAYLQISNN